LNDTSPAGVHDRLDIVIKQKAYRATSGGSLHVLDELAITLAGGEVAALVGPSGCGKTTLLRIIAGLDRDFDGHITLPAHGTLGMVFQEPRLLPWRTVEQNVRIAAPHAGEGELAALFETLGLSAHRAHYPGELSLGLARRVALARAFAVKPDLLLLDEPFVSLDERLASRLRILFLCASPARIMFEVPLPCPRAVRGPEQLAALREDIARRLKEPAG